MATEPHVTDLLGAYALGSLDKDDRQVVEQHLTTCLLCRRDLQAMETVAGELAFAAPQASPSTDLRRRLRSRGVGVTASRPAPVLRWAVAGMAALTLVLASTSALLWMQLNNQRVLIGPRGMRAVAMRSTDFAPNASGFVIVGADGQNGALVVDRLPQIDATHAYQVWLTNEQGTVSGATFSVDEYGYRGARINAPENLLNYDEVTITVEPTAGSAQPSGPVVLTAFLTKQ